MYKKRVTSGYARFFFICFWLTNQVLILNVLTAFVIKTFIPHWEKMKKGITVRQVFFEENLGERGNESVTYTSRNDFYDLATFSDNNKTISNYRYSSSSSNSISTN